MTNNFNSNDNIYITINNKQKKVKKIYKIINGTFQKVYEK